MIFYLLYFVFYVFLSWFRPKYALGLILLLLPTYQIKFQILKIPFTFLEIMILILFVAWLVKKLNNLTIKQFNNLSGGWLWIISLWLLMATVAMFVAPELRAGAGVWKAYFIEPILFLAVLVDLARNNQNATNKTSNLNEKNIVDIVLFSLSISALVCSLWAIGQKWLGGGIWSVEVWGQPPVWRATGPFSHPNFLGLYLAPLIILEIGNLIANFHKKFWFIFYCLLFVVLTPAALILARSEGAIVGVLAGLGFLGIVLKKSRKYVLIALVLVVLLAAIYPVSRHYILEKMFLQDLSGQFRLNIWIGAISLLEISPILGVGLDGYERLVTVYQSNNFVAANGEKFFAPVQPYPHNLFLAVWLELGLAGLIIFIWILAKFFKQGFKNTKNNNIILNTVVMGAMICILIHGLADTPYFKNDLAIVFWLIVGLMITFGNLKKEEVIKKELVVRGKI